MAKTSKKNNMALFIDDRFEKLKHFFEKINYQQYFDNSFHLECCDNPKIILKPESDYDNMFVFLDTSWDKYRPKSDAESLTCRIESLVDYIRTKKNTEFFVFPYSTIYRSDTHVKVVFDCFEDAYKLKSSDESEMKTNGRTNEFNGKPDNLKIVKESNWLRIPDFAVESEIAKIRWIEIAEMIKALEKLMATTSKKDQRKVNEL